MALCKFTAAFTLSFLSLSLHAAELSLIPWPDSVQENSEQFQLNKDARISYTDANAREPAEMLASYLRPATGYQLPVSEGTTGDILIDTIEDATLGEEGYTLEVNKEQVRIAAPTAAGLFYGGQTLRQLLPTEIYADHPQVVQWLAPGVQIRDQPQFSWRGQHLDVSRHFKPADWVKKFIDQLAQHKLNTMHWHLTDDQGWRVEIKAYPKLSEISAWRHETLIGHRSEKPRSFDGTPHGGYYTQDEIRDIVEYARKRHVTIVPEIEIPGHSIAALAAYPELGCTGGPYEVMTTWGISKEIYCAGNPDTFTFWKTVLDEVCELFPSKYIHTGGDEAPKDRWEQCPKCQQLITDLSLGDEHALQVHVTLEMEQHLLKKGRRLIGWDEIFEDGLSQTAAVMWWHKNKGKAIAEAGNGLVVAHSGSLYFDKYQFRDKTSQPLAIGGYVPIEKVYALNPIPEGLSTEDASHVLGAQAQLWTEYIPTTEHAEYMLFPRLCALAEITWLAPERKNFQQFSKRLAPHLQRLEHAGIHYAELD